MKNAPSHYKKYPRFFVAVDSVIFGFDAGELYMLIARRAYSPLKGEWALIGEFVKENEDVDVAARRVLEEITGLSDIYIKQIGAFGNAGRDSGARVVTVGYYALINRKDYADKLSDKHSACWVKISEIPRLVFDHNAIAECALEKMRNDALTTAAAFYLLTKNFTLTKLNKLFEAILGRPLDKRNFRKKIFELPYIKATGKFDKSESKRGAMLYRFDEKIYRQYEGLKLL